MRSHVFLLVRTSKHRLAELIVSEVIFLARLPLSLIKEHLGQVDYLVATEPVINAEITLDNYLRIILKWSFTELHVLSI